MYFNIDDYTIYYEKYGNKDKNIIILPGWGNTRITFNNIINFFRYDYSVYIFDYPGFGNSKIIDKEMTIYDYAYIIYSFIKRNNLDNSIIIAHSFGGRILSLLCGYYNLYFNKIILIDVAGINKFSFTKIIRTYTYKILYKISYLLPRYLKFKYRNYLLNKFGSSDYLELDINMRKTFSNIVKEDLRKYYKKISTDTLIIWGENDTSTSIKLGRYINKIIKNSSLIIYKNSSHFSYLDYPCLTNNIIEKYIKMED